MMSRKYLVNGPIQPDLIGKYIGLLSSSREVGGHSLFIGQVREDDIDGLKVKSIKYSAYDEMVTEEAEKIIRLTSDAFTDVHNIEILHSTGVVMAGEISLFVLVTAGHRDQAIRACRHVVEMIKLNYPVWKKEILDDDSHQWKENKS